MPTKLRPCINIYRNKLFRIQKDFHNQIILLNYSNAKLNKILIIKIRRCRTVPDKTPCKYNG